MKWFEQFSFALISNILQMAVSTIIILFLPKIIGVTEYGYFRLFLFYTSFAGILHFGWCDGIFLKYGGAFYDNIDKRLFNSTIKQYYIFQLIICTLLGILTVTLAPSKEKELLFLFVFLSCFATNCRLILLYIMQATGRIKEYSTNIVGERLFFLLLVALLFFAGSRDYVVYIGVNVVAIYEGFAFSVYQCKDLFKSCYKLQVGDLEETRENISIGLKLLLANLCSMFILGILQQAIEYKWDVATFGSLSLSMSVSNMALVLINAVSIVLFPMLRRVDESQLVPLYDRLRSFLMFPILGFLLFYYPLAQVLSWWLPKYATSLKYLAILLPICVFDSKLSMLVNTYLRALRQEDAIMRINMLVLVISFILTYLTVFVMASLKAAVYSILILVALRCVICELCISRVLAISVAKDILLEVILVFIFVFGNLFVGDILGTCVYALAFFTYLLIKKQAAIEVYGYLKRKFSNFF